jgi:hypothetical protein
MGDTRFYVVNQCFFGATSILNFGVVQANVGQKLMFLTPPWG